MDDDKILTAAQVCERIPNITPQYLAILRHRGGGPVYIKLGGRKILYRESDVNAWIKAGLHTRTDRPVA